MPRIVILSYGLQRRTREVLDRARRYGHPIHLVPAIPLATRGLRRHASSLVTVHRDVGRSGLDEALGPSGELVLLLHEDVLLSADGAAALLDAAAEGLGLVVPRTNHVDVDMAAGQLPPDVVQPVTDPEDPVEVRRLRSVCVAARSDRFRDLLRHRLTAAATRLVVGEGDAFALPHVTATDLDEARDQYEPPVGPDGRPLLVAAMIVKDEEDFLEGCLASLDGLVDRVVVCDTGSTDRTIEIARAAGAEVLEAPWRNDFAWARNQALERCRDAWWVLHIDADERVRVDDAEELRRFLATALPDRDGFDVPLQDIAADGSRLGGQQLPRLFPGEGTSYVGRVHEVPRYEDGRFLPWTVTKLLEIEHLGYQDEVVATRDKRARNLALARSDYDDAPTPLAKLQLARSLTLRRETLDELLELVAELRDMIVDGTDGLNEVGHIPVYQLYSQGLLMDGRPDEAWSIIEEGVERYPHSALLRAIRAEIGLATRRYEDVAASATADTSGDAARPTHSPVATAANKLSVALARLAIDDVDGAGAALDELYAMGVPTQLGSWPQLVSATALTRPDDVVELLRPVATADATGDVLRAVGATFAVEDAAVFAATVCATAAPASEDQLRVATELAVAADDVAVLDQLVADAGLDTDSVGDVLAGAGSAVSAWVRRAAGLSGAQPTADEVDAVLRGELDPDEAGAVLARDESGDGLRQLARTLDPSIAAPIAAAAVGHGARAASDVKVALALCTLADDAQSAKLLDPHVDALDRAVLDALMARATTNGSTAMLGWLTNALLRRP